MRRVRFPATMGDQLYWLKLQRERDDLKFWWEADTAKTDKSKCKRCKTPISKDGPRLQFRSDYTCDGMGNTFGFFLPACAAYVGEKWANFDNVEASKIQAFNKLPAAVQAAIKKDISGGAAPAKAKAKAKAVPQAEPKAKPKAKASGKRAAPSAESAPPPPKRARSGGLASVSGKTVCFTCSLTFVRSTATAKAISAGAKVIGDVSKNLNILVAGPRAGSKLTKAQSLGIEVWDQAKFERAVGM